MKRHKKVSHQLRRDPRSGRASHGLSLGESLAGRAVEGRGGFDLGRARARADEAALGEVAPPARRREGKAEGGAQSEEEGREAGERKGARKD